MAASCPYFAMPRNAPGDADDPYGGMLPPSESSEEEYEYVLL